MKALKIEDIKISDDKKLLDAENNITPYVESLIEKIHYEVTKGKEKTLKKLIKYTNQFPKVPQFKNYLMSFYACKENNEKATEINKWIIKEHPSYLYAKINYATVLLEENKNEEFVELLGDSLLLHELYPERELFLPDEIISYYKMTLHYLYKNNKIEEAGNRGNVLNVLFEGHYKIQDLESIKKHYYFSNINLFDGFADDDDFIGDEIKRKRALLQTNIAPEFNFPEQIKYLYTNTANNISKEQLNELIALNKNPLIDDLIKVIYDSMNRFDHFYKGDFSEKELCFPVHAFHLLIYFKTEKALEVVFDVLSQDFEYSDFWFNDLSFEYTSYFLDLYAKKHREKLLGFIKEEYVVAINKITVLESLMKSSSFKGVKKREVVVKELNEIIDFFIINQENPAINDFELNCFFVSELIDYGVIELLPKIKKMFDLGILATDFFGGYNQIEEDIKKFKQNLSLLKTYKTIHDVYEDFSFDEDFGEDDFLEEEEAEEEPKALEPQIKKEKTGRNDPCFCGSGKKYKKCCINL